MEVRHAVGVAPESRLRSRWEFESSTEVWTIVRGSAETNPRSPGACQKRLIGTRQVDRRKSRSLPEVRRSITEGSSDDRRKFAGSSPEEAIDAPEQVAVNVLRNVIVSM